MLRTTYDNLRKNFVFGMAEVMLTERMEWVSLERNGALWWRMVTECY